MTMGWMPDARRDELLAEEAVREAAKYLAPLQATPEARRFLETLGRTGVTYGEVRRAAEALLNAS